MSNSKKTNDLTLTKRVILLATPYKSVFISCVLIAIVLIPINILRPYLIERIVDDYLSVGDSIGMKNMVIAFIGALLLSVIFRYFFIYYTNYLGQSIVRDIRKKVFEKIISYKLSYFDKTPIGQSTTRTISDVEAINRIFTDGLITIISESAMIFAVLGFLFWTSWVLALICIVLLPILIFSTYIFKEKIRVVFGKVRNELSEMNSFVQERISGIKIVQIFNVEKKEYDNFKAINERYTKANVDAVFYYALFFPFVELIYALSLALMVWLGASNVISGYVSFGELVAFPIYLSMLYRPIRLLADRINTLQMGLIASERVFEVLDRDSHIEDKGEITKEIKGDVEFKDVSFSYEEGSKILHKINFKIRAGETLAIVGATGSGKSTLINLLCRFYTHEQGKILIDNIEIEKYQLKSLRESIGVILQDVFLFSGSVTDNIRLRHSDISLNEIKKAAQLIGAHEFIEELPEKYDFEVRERGATLSMGQRQLISFIRALVFDPEILILDEATSSIDPETESIIQNAIKTMISKRTSIIIAHRLSTIRHANNVLVIDQGKIIEQGNPTELLAKKDGFFKKLYEKQLETVGKVN